MAKLDLTYTHSYNGERYEKLWDVGLKKRADLTFRAYSDAFLLPSKPGGFPFGTGGVLDADKNEITESHLHIGNARYMGGSYDFDESGIRLLNGPYNYLGFIYNHWGHFLVDFSTRLWLSRLNSNRNLFLVYSGCDDYALYPQILRFLELYGINTETLLLVSEVTMVDEIIIPEQSFHAYVYYSQEYIDTFDEVQKNSASTLNSQYRHIYFSRQRINESFLKEIGHEVIESLFEKAGYGIVNPEDESLDDQIYYIRNCEKYACISGTLAHNIVFARGCGIKVLIVNKTSTINTILNQLCFIFEITPLFLDFYAQKYPSNLGIGPFLLVHNEIMDLFIKDNDIAIDRKKYFSTYYLFKSIKKYEVTYYKTYPHPTYNRETSNSYNRADFFGIENLIEFLDNYSRYEIYNYYIAYKLNEWLNIYI